MERNADIAIEKAALRARMINARRSIPERLRMEMSESIAGHVLELPEIVHAHHIHLYLTMHSHAEVDTAAIIDGLSRMDKQLSVPVIMDGRLMSAAFRKGEPLRFAQFRQPEPEVVSLIDESQLDVVLIPLLAFDEKGYRLGYGKGFYDFFLQRLFRQGINPSRIGLSFSRQMVDVVPADPWDEALDGVVHENGSMRFV
ncbi:MAG: 5-formyltetrahydrofolate cyclo-ligase [Chlorobiaceae bacterium]